MMLLVGLALALQEVTPVPAEPRPTPAPIELTAQAGAVRATVSCEPERDGSPFCAPRRLEIVREGSPPFEATFQGNAAYLMGDVGDRKSLEVLDLDRSGEPEVLLNLYSGGAHCCYSTRIYTFAAEATPYASLFHEWGNAGYRLEDLDADGGLEFVTGDDQFDTAFTSHAASRRPPQVWRYAAGRLTNATRSYPGLLEKDAAECWKAFQELSPKDPTGDQVRGVLAAYLADQYLLGRGSEGWRRLIEVYRKPDRKKFFAQLTAFLQKSGYNEP
jgi:hypothetical protein